MGRIGRYVFREIAGPTILGVLVYGTVLVMNLLREAAELLIRRDLPSSLVAQYLLLSFPRIIVLAIPMAVLLGILVGVGRMSSDNEVTALRSLGYSGRRLMAPVLLLGLLGSLIAGLVFDLGVPAANYAQHKLNAKIFLAADINREIQPRVFYERIPNMLIYADTASPSDGTLRDVLIYQRTAAGQEELAMAGSLHMQQQAEQGSIQFQLDNVVSHAWQSGLPDDYQITQSDHQTIDRPPDLVMQEMIRSLAAPPPRNLREQTIPDLRQTLEELRAMPASRSVHRQINETLVELHKKLALPATSLAFAILGLPLALGHRRSGRRWGFAVSLLVIVLAYAMLTAGEQLADRGLVPPGIAMWAGNLLFSALGLLLLFTGSRFDLSLRFRRSRRPASEAALEPGAAGAQPAGSPSSGQRQFPSILDRYLLRYLSALSLLVALSLAVLFSLFYAVNLIDDLARGNKDFMMLFPYLMYIQPQILFASVAPISLCIGTLLTFTLLARTNELTAMRAGGVALLRVATPFITAGAVVGFISFLAHDAVLPYTNQSANRLRDEIRDRSPRSYRQPARRWVFTSTGHLVNFGDFHPTRQEFQDLAVFRFKSGTFQILERVFAARAHWEQGAWQLRDGWTRRFSDRSEIYDAFTTKTFAQMDPPDYFLQDWKAPDQMNYRDLRRYVLDLEQRGYDTRELRVGLYRKVAIPFVCVVMVLIALPFAVRVEHRGPVFAIGLSILLAFVYFALLQAFGKLGEVARLPPLLAAWAPNLMFSGIGLYLTATGRW